MKVTDYNLNLDSTEFPQQVYDNLPEFLMELCGRFADKIEREVFLTGALGVISGCLPTLFGVYDNRKVGCNLYIFIQSPASAGKGNLIYTYYLGKSIHDYRRELTKEAMTEYHADMEMYNAAKKEKKAPPSLLPPEQPKQKVLFIPANTSASAFLDTMTGNDGYGILFCTEADTLNDALKQDWGNYSDSMRCAFHHEPINQLRKSNKEYIEIDKPFLSIILSGTPAQLHALIPNVENGLFSRFCFYDLKMELKWKDIFACYADDLEEYFLKKGEVLLHFYKYLKALDHPVRFSFTEKQQSRFNEKFAQWQVELADYCGNDLIPTVRRLGLINFRIAMLLTALRYIGKNGFPESLVCSETDFETAGLITDTFKTNAICIYQNLPQATVSGMDNPQKIKFYQSLPDEFTREDAVKMGLGLRLSTATVDRLLKSSKLIQKAAYGKYVKLM